MKLIDYLKDKAFDILLYFVTIILIVTIFLYFELNITLMIMFILLIVIIYIIVLLHGYLKRKNFYNKIYEDLNNIDQKYLINELIKDSGFLEGKILIDYLYQIDKNYIEHLNNYKNSLIEFKEYIELWCHEIKTPVATSKLIIDNHKSKVTESILDEINNIEKNIDQILFYSRSENVEKDYIITKTNLKDTINKVIYNNKKDILSKHIKVNNIINDIYVESDSKWLEYIINQIFINSIKYSKEKKALISFEYKENKNNIELIITDNGIGIKEDEIEKIFNKGFTGTNGRKEYKSTGFGLYLVKKLCNKLGHNISAKSKYNEYTKITLIFPNNSMVK